MTTTFRRLPGFRFETQPPPARDVLPRMDVAVFVGFAAAGPLNIPTLIEDPLLFAAIFGADLPLAWNAERGEMAYAHLAPAVRAFFRCGGRRCYVIRVAQAQVPAHIALPGMAAVSFNPDDSVNQITPAVAQARSQGSWADGLRVSTALLTRPIRVLSLEGLRSLVVAGDVVAGDLLRLTDRISDVVYYGVARAVTARPVGSRVDLAHLLRVSTLVVPAPDTPIILYGRVEGGESVRLIEAEAVDPDMLELRVALALADAPPVGSMLTVNMGAEFLVMMVRDVRGGEPEGLPLVDTVYLTCTGVRCQSMPALPAATLVAERLSFELRVRSSAEQIFTLPDLTFSPAHPRFWNHLPGDEAWFGALHENDTLSDLWREAGSPRFPLAGGLPDDTFTFPFGVPILPEIELLPYRSEADALTREGLAVYDTTLFLDDDLTSTTLFDLMGRADYLRYLSPDAGPLTGIHAAMAVEEATLIAVPDALAPGWELRTDTSSLTTQPSKPLAQPDWSAFLNCGFRVLPAPELLVTEPDSVGTFTLSWEWESDEPTGTPTFTLEEATMNDFSGALMLYTGTAQTYTVYGRTRGDYYYRVMAVADGNHSDWSNGIGVRVSPAVQWVLKAPNPDAEQLTVSVQRALIRLCGARGDMVAVLALPEHLREDQSAAYVRELTPSSTRFASPLSFAEARALSYAAVYHPWLYSREGARVVSSPPDGAMCGMIARRSIARGAWIAPANEAIPGVLALTPALKEERQLDLLLAQINLIKPSPYGFIAQSADTLSLDVDYGALNVRRLLILLRRLVLQRGTQYVFEPYDDVFRRMVQRSLESVLEQLFTRGAFAGAAADAAFQVVPRSTPQDVDQGRFIVDLKVAPSLPMEFVTVRLIQSGDRSIVSEER